MVPKINGLGRSFAGVAAYCLHDAPEPDDRSPETSERVAWTDTRNLPTIRAERAARLMAATAKAAPDLKRLAGGARGGREGGASWRSRSCTTRSAGRGTRRPPGRR